jgi:hypothetical protein
LERYGFEHPWQNAQIQEKRKITFLEKYGVECPLKHADVQDKKKATILKKYGVENISQNVNLKQDAFKKAGYNCEIWVMNDKGDIVEKIE